MTSNVNPDSGKEVSLQDRWTVDSGRIVISGNQAIARILLDQLKMDRATGLKTGGYISGYRGSPLGGVDSALWSIGKRLEEAGIVFQPGVNEEIAATAVRGTQQIAAVPNPKVEGVVAAWYGKGPGVDRSGDAFKHGNYAGAHPNGGVLVFYGDDHSAKSSTVAHHSEQAVAASNIPSLYPSTTAELHEYGLLGIALSRYSGSWVALKCVTEVVEQTASVDIDLPAFQPVLPARPATPGLHIGGTIFDPVGEERVVVEARLPLVKAFARANGIDRVVIDAPQRRVGIITAGKAYGETRAALRLLGLDDRRCAELGVSLYKVGMIWPLEPLGIREFAQGHEMLIVVEEKAAFLEPQIAAVLINEQQRPLVVGKSDIHGAPLFSTVAALEPTTVARALRRVMSNADIPTILSDNEPESEESPIEHKRSPYFCSGCPHNRSTRLPDGSVSMTGIGCHTMVNFVRPDEALLPVQMGGEGANWIGLAPFTNTHHIFQNLGDGTYFHSGLLAIRAAVAANVNITYKILYNDAVAMTGGQPVDGTITVSAMAQQVLHEGVAKVVVVSDNPDWHRKSDLPSPVRIYHRDELDDVQRELRDVAGCTVLIYEQTCAAEKRRRRKKKEMPDPPKRMFIAKSVCEGCGDCSEMSTCVSLMPIETAFGVKREIDQSSCNKDYSCADGFCPSFVTVHDAEPIRAARRTLDAALFSDLPMPETAPLVRGSYDMIVAGIGGTGVVTVGAVIAMAAHIDGLAMSTFDMTGVSQKNGAVYSHLKVASDVGLLESGRIALGGADALLGFDLVASLTADGLASLSSDRTRAIVNADVTPTAAFQFDRELRFSPHRMIALLERRVRPGGLVHVDAKTIAEVVLGDAIGTNMFLVGVAAQAGLLPVSLSSLEKAIALNGVAVPFNLDALNLGRLYSHDPAAIAAMMAPATAVPDLPVTLDEVMAHRADHLSAYQGDKLRSRYLAMMDHVRGKAGDGPVAMAVARIYAKLLSYKDEYEVARLLSGNRLRDELDAVFGRGGRIEFNMAPPLLSRKGRMGRPRKRAFSSRILPFLRLLARMKWLRGTAFDPFGRTDERKMERLLIIEYETLIEQVLEALDPDDQDDASELLMLADSIKGYGPVKEAAVEAYRGELPKRLARYLAGNRPQLERDTVGIAPEARPASFPELTGGLQG